MRELAIALAVLGAVAMAFGAQFQNDEVVAQQKKITSGLKQALNLKQLTSLLSRPKWLSGTTLLGVGLVLQLAALSLAPIIVVQPIGAIALVITSFLNAKITKTRLNRGTMIAIGLCTIGVGSFVFTASGVASTSKVDDDQLRLILLVLLIIMLAFGALFLTVAKRAKAITYIIGAGVLYGFVATLAKVVIARAQQFEFEWLTVICLGVLIAAAILGGWFVQNAYASGPPDLVIAGLTVIDPLVAVGIGIVILREAKDATMPTILGFALSAVIAAVGVLLLSRVHPELQQGPVSAASRLK